ncbi:hypothetical protein [Methylobacterium sp. Leaf118]|uniref:hypothetical protein n=1 Tax=Methylobacterium sp. Leaf118 TaxID=2876562 RepID=UPI001E58C133|nr:hypothetical protein [Methylobacterium sp. Leaf118]
MTPPPLTLYDEACARLSLFDDVPEDILERLAAGGFGRGLLTASLRARLRKAGYTDLGMLARATPAELMAVRKVGPLRVEAIRAHLVGALARLAPGARAAHGREATDQRRLDRCRAVPVERLPLDPALVARLGEAGDHCADLALRPRFAIARALALSASDLDRIVAALARIVLPDRPPVPSAATAPEEEAGGAAQGMRARAALQEARDREWDAAAPARPARPARTT